MVFHGLQIQTHSKQTQLKHSVLKDKHQMGPRSLYDLWYRIVLQRIRQEEHLANVLVVIKHHTKELKSFICFLVPKWCSPPVPWPLWKLIGRRKTTEWGTLQSRAGHQNYNHIAPWTEINSTWLHLQQQQWQAGCIFSLSNSQEPRELQSPPNPCFRNKKPPLPSALRI